MADIEDVLSKEELRELADSRAARKMLAVWVEVHRDHSTGLVAMLSEAFAEALLMEWPQWVDAVQVAADEYIVASSHFIADQLTAEAYQDMARVMWDRANGLFVEIMRKRLQGAFTTYLEQQLSKHRSALLARWVSERQAQREAIQNPPSPSNKTATRTDPRSPRIHRKLKIKISKHS